MPKDQYTPVPTEKPRQIATPSIHVTTPDVHFTRAIGEAMGELGHGFGVLGGAQQTVGAALGSAGRMIEGAGNELFQRAQAIQEVKNQAEENELRTKYDIESGQLFAQFEAKSGLDASNGYDAFVEGQRKIREDFKSKASNPDVGRRFDNATMQTMGRTIFSGARHAATEQKRSVVSASEARIAQEAINVEKNYQDPEQYRQSLSKVRQEVESQRWVMGLPKEVADVKSQEEVLKIGLARLNGMAKEKPFEAWDLFNKLKESGDIYGPKAEQLEHTIQEQVRRTTARRASDDATADLRSDSPDLTKTLEERQRDAADKARAVVADDDEVVDRAIKETNQKWNTWNAGQQQFHRQAMDQIIGGVSGRKSDGNIPRSIDELMAIPGMGPLYDKLNDREKSRVRDMIYEENRKEQRVDPLTSMENFGRIRGTALNNPDEFFAMNPYDPKLKLNPHERAQMIKLREDMSKDPVGRSDLVKRYLTVLRSNFGGPMEALGVYSRTKETKDDFDKMTNAVQQSVEVFFERHQRMPTPQEFIKDLAPEIIKYKPGSWFPWRSEERPVYMSPPPSEWVEEHEKRMKARGLPAANEWELQRDWTRHQLIELEAKRAK